MFELLAPAGDKKSFDAAIAAGADAIYLGLDDFNARMKADNFSVEDLRSLVERAHFYGVKIYLTINTILQNAEFNHMFTLVKAAVEAKVDAFIVQDIGVAAALIDAFDGIVLHASTQLGVHNVYGARIAEEIGFTRVVLSRETTLEDIRAIRRETGLELEYFVQGALCVAFSGNCYLSAVEQDASGNRGLCKQMCRLPYEAELDGIKASGYLLSARDICLASSLEELAEAGVTSFKIEGRMRREGYVAQTVSLFRRLLDRMSIGDHKLDDDEMRELKLAFNRGEYLTRAYLDGGAPSVIEKRFNGHIGVPIGKVLSVKPFKKGLYEVKVASSHALKSGDGLKFFDHEREVASLGVGDPTEVSEGIYTFVTAVKVATGAVMNLTRDSALEARLLARRRYVDVDMKVYAMVGEPLTISAVCRYITEDGFEDELAVMRWQDGALEKAIKAPVDEAQLRAQACKTADTGFNVVRCDVQTDGVFVAKSVFNSLRREVLEELRRKLILAREGREVFVKDIERTSLSGAVKCADATLRIVRSEDLPGSIAISDGVVLSPNDYTVEEVQRMLDCLDMSADEVALQLPVIANERDIAVIEKLLARVKGLCTLVSENIYGLHFVREGYSVIAGAGHNIANDRAAAECEALGATAVIAGEDCKSGLSEDADVTLCNIENELPLMTFAHCPYKTLFGNDCAHCSFKPGLTLKRERHTYSVRRIKASRCYFGLYADK